MITRPGKYMRRMYFAPWDTTRCLPMDEMIDIKGVANELAVSTRSIQFWEAKGWMPLRQQRGRELLYRRTDIAQIKAVVDLTRSLSG